MARSSTLTLAAAATLALVATAAPTTASASTASASGPSAVGTSAVGTSAVGTSAVGTSAVGTSAVGTDTGWAGAERAIVYRATAPYQRHANAVKAGYVPDKYCIADRAGTGALGYPHFRHAYDNSVDPAKPAALFYEDDGLGGKRLVGVQWVVYDRDQDVATDEDRPSMFGEKFTGPHRGHFRGQPVHYAMHMWLWKENPKGAFQTYNPAVTCLPGTTRPLKPAPHP